MNNKIKTTNVRLLLCLSYRHWVKARFHYFDFVKTCCAQQAENKSCHVKGTGQHNWSCQACFGCIPRHLL